MSEPRKRRVGELDLEIDVDLCVGFGECVTAAPVAFALDEDDLAVFVRPEEATREALVRACESCPVDAITLFGPAGERLAP